ncbi:MAG: hypothetical protein ALECFALPRED_008788 [Alectoria fallacina]|uniref:Uncharacterized protein n=1 Tax=Alectoria fallacina TaxID=1903189 RepID=A0A8H3J4L8_9LECA|nr:MAG: hypothetical protein ALECFALPRED_008788 [Alectoria fallacina]
MRNTLRLLAAVKPGRYLEAGDPTGLTGLSNHPAPRSALLYLYGATLDKLKTFPDHSVYRQSAEALTIHRMSIIESIKPEGYDEWAKKAAEKIEKHPEAFQPGGNYVHTSAGGQDFVTDEDKTFEDQEWAALEGPRSPEEKAAEIALLKKGRRQDYSKIVNWEPEPPLEASQYVRRLQLSNMISFLQIVDALVYRISDAENQIGGGLIEEVIQVAEGELKLVETMAESEVWDELEEKPPQARVFALAQSNTPKAATPHPRGNGTASPDASNITAQHYPVRTVQASKVFGHIYKAVNARTLQSHTEYAKQQGYGGYVPVREIVGVGN